MKQKIGSLVLGFSMVKKIGIFEINEKEGYVRIKHTEGSYEYIVSKDIYGTKNIQATNLFLTAYRIGVMRTQNKLKKAIGLK